MAGASTLGIGALSTGTPWPMGRAFGAEPPEPPPPSVPDDEISAAADLIGLQFTPEERKLMNTSVAEHRDNYARLRGIVLENDVPPAFTFNPVIPGLTAVAEGMGLGGYRLSEAVRISQRPVESHLARSAPPPPMTGRSQHARLPNGPDGPLGIPSSRRATPSVNRPTNDDDLAYLPAQQLGELIRTRQLSSLELTRIYLARINRLNPQLLACITVTEDLALRQAQRRTRTPRGRGAVRCTGCRSASRT